MELDAWEGILSVSQAVKVNKAANSIEIAIIFSENLMLPPQNEVEVHCHGPFRAHFFVEN